MATTNFKNEQTYAKRERGFYDQYDDLIVSAVGINPSGLTAPPALNATTGLLEFSGTADNGICGVWQLPHGWTGAITAGAEGQFVYPHLHVRFTTSTATNTRWKFEVDRFTPNGNHENVYGSFTTIETITVANPQNVAKSALVSFSPLDMTGYTKGSAMIHFRVTRLAQSDAADNYTGIVALESMDCHVQRRAPGSVTEIPV